MGWNCTVALTKCLQRFGRNEKATLDGIELVAPGKSPSSCYLTLTMLSRMISPGIALGGATLVDKKGVFVPNKAIDRMKTLLDGDSAIYVSVKRDHHFTVLPLDDRTVSILQGFQGTYTLYEWITQSEKAKMNKAAFLSSFAHLLSPTLHVAQEAAVFLFSIPGREGDVREYFTSRITVKDILGGDVNLFGNGASRARLGEL